MLNKLGGNNAANDTRERIAHVRAWCGAGAEGPLTPLPAIHSGWPRVLLSLTA